MNRREFIFLVFAGGAFAQESFKDFLKEELEGYRREKEGFARYLEEVNREFEEYKRIAKEEFERFRHEVLRHWGRYEATDRKKLVQYSEDYRVKRVFDFEKGELRIEAKDSSIDFESLVEKELGDFLLQDEREAFRSDRLLGRVESRVRKLRHVKTAKLGREPVLTPIVFGKDSVSSSELRRGVKSLLERGNIEKRWAGNSRFTQFKVRIPPKKVLRKARQYKPVVVRESDRWGLDYPLIFAIIHTESYFNPLATSPAPAYGLMQIVPHSAGRDATELLFGRPVLLAPSYLYNSENNVRVGTAYVYLLYYKYFKDVRNPESRLYCTIAAYNTGPGNVARALTGTTSLRKASVVVNAMDPEDVYRTLLRRLPYRETKDYLRKVSARIAVYKNL